MLHAIEDCDKDGLQTAAASYMGPLHVEAFPNAMKFAFEIYLERCANDAVRCDKSFLKHAFEMFGILCTAMARQKGRQRVYDAIMEKADDDDASVFDVVNKAGGKKMGARLRRWMCSWF